MLNFSMIREVGWQISCKSSATKDQISLCLDFHFTKTWFLKWSRLIETLSNGSKQTLKLTAKFNILFDQIKFQVKKTRIQNI